MNYAKKKLAILSVSDKKNIDKLARELIKNNYIILSTGGTANTCWNSSERPIINS